MKLAPSSLVSSDLASHCRIRKRGAALPTSPSCRDYWDGHHNTCDTLSGMPFEIQWTSPVGLESTRRKSAVDAVRYAVQMFGRGYTAVVIVDLAENSKAYSLADFRQFYLDAKR
jgi:hypothetical protein